MAEQTYWTREELLAAIRVEQERRKALRGLASNGARPLLSKQKTNGTSCSDEAKGDRRAED
jgi:hypothetical protein